MNNQSKCQLGDYGEETIGSDHYSPKHILFIPFGPFLFDCSYFT